MKKNYNIKWYRKIVKIFKKTLLFIVVLISFILLIIFIARIINYFKYSIASENGVNIDTFVNINNLEHHVQIRGKNKENPIILFLHGGPGFPIGYLSTSFQSELEENYTIVHYDQRHCGRTYYKNLDENYELNYELLLEDLDAMVEYLKEKYNKDKIVILGQSWGSVLGLTYANTHPENVEAYIGVGQVIDFDQGKVEAANEAIKLASEEDIEILNDEVEKFKEVDAVDKMDVENIETLILTSIKYLKGDKEQSAFNMIWSGLKSSYMNLDDIKWYLNASSTKKIIDLEEELINYMYFEFDAYNLSYNYEVPIYFISGGNDWITPYTMVEKYYNSIEAIEKDMIIIPETGHTLFLDSPKEFTAAINSLLTNSSK